MSAYVNKEKIGITRKEWEILQENEEYCTLKLFENDRFRVAATWVGAVQNMKSSPKEFWQPFKLVVHNIITKDCSPGERILAEDPTCSVLAETEEETLSLYQDFLESYTACHWCENDSFYADESEANAFVEVGNIHAKSDDHTTNKELKPTSFTESNPDAGSW